MQKRMDAILSQELIVSNILSYLPGIEVIRSKRVSKTFASVYTTVYSKVIYILSNEGYYRYYDKVFKKSADGNDDVFPVCNYINDKIITVNEKYHVVTTDPRAMYGSKFCVPEGYMNIMLWYKPTGLFCSFMNDCYIPYEKKLVLGNAVKIRKILARTDETKEIASTKKIDVKLLSRDDVISEWIFIATEDYFTFDDAMNVCSNIWIHYSEEEGHFLQEKTRYDHEYEEYDRDTNVINYMGNHYAVQIIDDLPYPIK